MGLIKVVIEYNCHFVKQLYEQIHPFNGPLLWRELLITEQIEIFLPGLDNSLLFALFFIELEVNAV